MAMAVVAETVLVGSKVEWRAKCPPKNLPKLINKFIGYTYNNINKTL